MTTNLMEVRQDSLTTLADGQCPPLPFTRMGIPAYVDKWDYFALAGRMFQVTQTTVGTPLTNSAVNAAGIVVTVPTARFDVPTGYTIFPRRFTVAFTAMAGTLNEIALVSATSASTTGGLALTPLNMRQDQPTATVVTKAYHCSGAAITEGALTNVRFLYQSVDPLAFAAAAGHKNVEVVWKDLHPVVGPCKVLLFVGAATTASTAVFTLEWAEVPTASVKAA